MTKYCNKPVKNLRPKTKDRKIVKAKYALF